MARELRSARRTTAPMWTSSWEARVSLFSGRLASRFSSAALTARVQLPVTEATLAMRRGEPARALELLNTVTPYDHAPSSEFWPPYLRGLAYLQLKNGHAAGAQFESILGHRGQAPASPLYPSRTSVSLARRC